MPHDANRAAGLWLVSGKLHHGKQYSNNMLRQYFISFLGALTAIWISFMLLVVLMLTFAIGSVVSAIGSQEVAAKIEKNSILCLNLSTQIEEDKVQLNLYDLINEVPQPESLVDIIGAIDAARSDRNIAGIFVKCDGASAGIATREAIRDALTAFRKSGKWVISYADTYTQGDYYVASASDEMYLNPIGEVELKGLATGIPFFKTLLDKAGVEMQVVKVGTFKSAVEPYLLTHMSEANRLQTHVYLDNIWGKMTEEIATSRGITKETINQLADSMIVFSPAEDFVEYKLVDGLKYGNEMESYLKGKVGKEEDDDLNMLSVGEYIAAGAEVPNTKSQRKKIAVYYACGDIVDSGVEGIVSSKVVPDILDIADDDDIDAMVLRVNSGGGSAYASEQIWHALEVFKSKGKTLYVSMGDVAASGGYYISCGAEKIYAEPMTITGSIGIFGMIPCVKGLLTDKIGVNFDFVQTNDNTTAPNLFEPMTPFQRARMQKMVDRGYDLFTRRCADGRHMSQDSIKAIAEGRVWDGMTAKKIGLVDNLGSLNDAIADLAKAKGYTKYEIVNYTKKESSFWDMVANMQGQMKAAALKEQLGEYYPIVKHLQSIKDMDEVQARMPETVIE